MSAFDVIVVGGGIIGTSSAFHLSRRGHKVLVMDQVDIPNPQGSSDDHARVFRFTHGKDSFYTGLAAKTAPLWKSLQQETRAELFVQHGMLELVTDAGKYETESMKVLQDLKVSCEKIKPKEICERYRMLKKTGFKWGLYHSGGGMVFAKKAIEMFAKGVEKAGGRLESGVRIVKILRDKNGVTGLRDSKGKVWKAGHYIFASGAWSREILSDWGIPFTMTRQECLYLRPPRNQGRYRPAHFPVMSLHSKGFHAFPVHIHGFMKVGSHKKGVVNRKAVSPLVPDKKFEKTARGILRKFCPDLADFSDLEGRVYYYTRTPDEDFVLDKLPGLPNAWVAAAFSGNGPMFAPLIGKTVSELVSGEKPETNLHRFRLGRLKLKKK
jgi:monomeric sarcosine oxidase